MRSSLMAQVVAFGLIATGCSSKDAKDSPGAKDDPKPALGAPVTAVAKITSEEQVCDALTPAEVEAELHEKVTARMLPRAGQYGAPECGWLTSDGPDAHGVKIVMFFNDSEGKSVERSKQYFADKLASLCKPEAKREIPDLGDEAALCGGLWVRKGTTFFSIVLRRPTGTPDERMATARHLVEHVLPRLP
jgi:hypothetical protein